MREFHQKPTTFVGEVSINVVNLNQSITFYKDVIGFQVLSQTESKAILTADGKTPLLLLEQPSGVVKKENRTTGLYHFALLLPKRTDLANFLTHLVELQYPLGASDHYVSEALYISDPDGNGIEVYYDRPSSEWTWSNGEVQMATEPLDGSGLLAIRTEKWSVLPTETVMGHIHLHVSDLTTTEEFYIKGLGFEIATHYPGALFISDGGYHHHIGLNVWNGVGAKAPKENSVGLNWYSLVFADDTARNKTVEQLQSIGVEVTKIEDYYVTADPSGNVIRLVL